MEKFVVPGTALTIKLNEPSQFTDMKNSYVTLLKNATQIITKKDAQVIVKHGGSDIRHYNAVGCDGVTFGPIGSGLHTDEEWVDCKSLETYFLILRKFLLSV